MRVKSIRTTRNRIFTFYTQGFVHVMLNHIIWSLNVSKNRPPADLWELIQNKAVPYIHCYVVHSLQFFHRGQLREHTHTPKNTIQHFCSMLFCYLWKCNPPPFFFFKVLAFSQNVCCPVARGENYGSFIYIYTYLVCTNTSRSKLNDISSSYEIIQLCCWTQKYLVVVLKHIVDIGLLCPDLGHSWTLRF